MTEQQAGYLSLLRMLSGVASARAIDMFRDTLDRSTGFRELMPGETDDERMLATMLLGLMGEAKFRNVDFKRALALAVQAEERICNPVGTVH